LAERNDSALRAKSTRPDELLRFATPRGYGVVVAVVLGAALAYMSDDMLNIAIPSVARDLGGTVTDVQWIEDQGVASGVNNVASQLAGLMAIVVFPAAAGLAGKSITSPVFVGGFQHAILVATGLAIAALVLAAVTFGLPGALAEFRPRRTAMIRRGSRPG
jgi:hypothetical protein